MIEKKYNTELIHKAINCVGNASKLATALRVTYSCVLLWQKGESFPNPINCMKIEKLTKGLVKKEDLLPDYEWDDI